MATEHLVNCRNGAQADREVELPQTGPPPDEIARQQRRQEDLEFLRRRAEQSNSELTGYDLMRLLSVLGLDE